MVLGWGTRRKMLYTFAALIIIVLASVALYISFFNNPPSCFDNKKNADEEGVDCGGSCSLLCASTAHAPVVLWSRSVALSTSTYSAVAYIQNTNGASGAKNVHYTFQLFDAANTLITEVHGITDLPPVQTIPIIQIGIQTGNRIPTRTLFSFNEIPVWNKVSSSALPSLVIGNENLSADGVKLSAAITNASLIDVHNVTAEAVIFDTNNVAIAASKSLVPGIASKGFQNVVFTWPQPFQNVSHAEITLLPSF